MQTDSSLVRAENVIDVKVKNNAKVDLGKVEDIVISKVEGEVQYAVLSFGGLMGMGDKLFAIPWKALHYDPTEDCFILDVAKEKLKNAPGFDKEHWPNFAEESWATSISKFYTN